MFAATTHKPKQSFSKTQRKNIERLKEKGNLELKQVKGELLMIEFCW